MSAQQIPDKLYFKIGEVSDILGVKPYVLRYWESEFKQLTPSKSRTNQRLYKRQDVETLMLIKELLYKQRFTINGAKKRLRQDPVQPKKSPKTSQLGLDLASKSNEELNAKAEALTEQKQTILKGLKNLASEMRST